MITPSLLPPKALVLLFSLILAVCATPAQRLDQRALQLGFERYFIKGTVFTHAVYVNTALSLGQAGPLHVYLDGDGTPFLNRYWVAADPTPRNPLVLNLMAQDTSPSLYLGRPCYHGQAGAAPCSPLLWTTLRYSPAVVASMAGALQKLLQKYRYADLVFIGYSGGGTLAMLLAERFAQTRAVITVAGNLDPQRWTAWHGYTPLEGSLNPALRPPLPETIVQLHYFGGRDDNVPPELISGALAHQSEAKVIIEATYDHSCCWNEIWPAILDQLQAALSRQGRFDTDESPDN